MMQNYRKKCNVPQTIPNPATSPNRLLQQRVEVYASPQNIVLQDVGIVSFGPLGFGQMGASPVKISKNTFFE